MKGKYRLLGKCGEMLAEISGTLRHKAMAKEHLPAVGDWVLANARPLEHRATIRRILDRKSKISRKVAGEKTAEQIVATNLDTIFLVTSLNQEFNIRRMERYLLAAWESGASPVILLNKVDLCHRPDEFVGKVMSIAPGVSIHKVSAVTCKGLDTLDPYLGFGQTAALVGSSGVGKSTIINRLLGNEVQHVQLIRACDDHGRHTTSSRQLLLLSQGGMIIDTPGMRELQIWESLGGLTRTFEDIEQLATGCRFRDCHHRAEPGCRVGEALRDGAIAPERFESYQKLQKELRYIERKQDALARALEEKKWRKIHKTLSRMDKWI